ncbi:MAG: peptide chain release factor N(5)-glutamine methyltransferase [Bacilli bacterium]
MINTLENIIKLGISKTEAIELIKVSKNINKDYKLLTEGYPIQYLIGYVDFYGEKIIINKDVLIPRYETETLVEKTIQYLKESKINNPKVLDLCTGSGCISVALNNNINISSLTCTDISSSALKVVKENLDNNKIKADIILSDMFKNIQQQKFDLIISNPPYVPQDYNLSNIVSNEPINAIKADDNGSYYIKQIINEYPKYASSSSLVAIEICEDNLKTIKPLLDSKQINYTIEKDLTNKIRYIFIKNNL